MFSGDQSFSRDRQVDLMGDEWGHIRYPFWGFWFQLGLNPVLPWKHSGLFCFFPVYYGFFGFWGEPDGNLESPAPGEYQPLWPPDPDEGGTTGHLWWGLMGGEVRNMHHISRGRYEPCWRPQPYVLGDLVGFRISRIF